VRSTEAAETVTVAGEVEFWLRSLAGGEWWREWGESVRIWMSVRKSGAPGTHLFGPFFNVQQRGRYLRGKALAETAQLESEHMGDGLEDALTHCYIYFLETDPLRVSSEVTDRCPRLGFTGKFCGALDRLTLHA